MRSVVMADGSTYRITALLAKGDRNVKLAKSDKAGRGYLTYGLSLAPAEESGFNVCQFASAGCKAGCLFKAGHGPIPSVVRGRIAKTRYFFLHRAEFLQLLTEELHKARARARRKGLTLAVRLNVISDLPWERIAPELFATFSDVQFYDYTKRPGRIVPKNYHLTFSRSEANDPDALTEIKAGRNVAVVFSSKTLPAKFYGRRVVSGDDTDLRFLDPKRSIIGLYAKGPAKADRSGFVVPSPEGC